MGAPEGEIFILHVVKIPSAHFSSVGESWTDIMEKLFVIKLFEKIYCKLNVLKKAYSDVRIGVFKKMENSFNEVRDLSLSEKADIDIRGENGILGINDFLIGSLTEKVVRSFTCPVITVNQEINHRPIQNIVYAIDLKEEHPALINLIKNPQKMFGEKCIL